MQLFFRFLSSKEGKKGHYGVLRAGKSFYDDTTTGFRDENVVESEKLKSRTIFFNRARVLNSRARRLKYTVHAGRLEAGRAGL